MKHRLRIATPLAAALLASCTDFGEAPEPPPVTVTEVVITSPSAASVNLDVGLSLQFAAEAHDPGGSRIAGATISWSSTNSTIATIDATGRATALLPGTTSVQAQSGGKISSPVQLVVQPATPTVAAVVITSPATASVELDVGLSLQFTAEARDSSGAAIAGASIAWSSSDATVASIDTTGRATALVPGTTSVQAESDGVISSPVQLVVQLPAPDYRTKVQPIFNARCVECHGANGGLALEPDASYDDLVNVPSFGGTLLRVKPGDPDHSYLVVKIEGPCPGPVCRGSRMPFGRAPLNAQQIQIIRDWIAAGAAR